MGYSATHRYGKAATAPGSSDFWAGVRPRPACERRHIIDSQGGRTLVNAAIAFQHFRSEWRQRCAAAARTAWCGRRHGLGEGLVHAVEQQPRALVRHPHLTRGGRDRAGVTDAFEQLRFAGADPRAGFKNDADPDPRHARTVPRAKAQSAVDFPEDRLVA
jgi:hypothetical protein